MATRIESLFGLQSPQESYQDYLTGMMVTPQQMGQQNLYQQLISTMANAGALGGASIGRMMGGRTSQEVRSEAINQAYKDVSAGEYKNDWEKLDALARQLEAKGLYDDAAKARKEARTLKIADIEGRRGEQAILTSQAQAAESAARTATARDALAAAPGQRQLTQQAQLLEMEKNRKLLANAKQSNAKVAQELEGVTINYKQIGSILDPKTLQRVPQYAQIITYKGNDYSLEAFRKQFPEKAANFESVVPPTAAQPSAAAPGSVPSGAAAALERKRGAQAGSPPRSEESKAREENRMKGGDISMTSPFKGQGVEGQKQDFIAKYKAATSTSEQLALANQAFLRGIITREELNAIVAQVGSGSISAPRRPVPPQRPQVIETPDIGGA